MSTSTGSAASVASAGDRATQRRHIHVHVRKENRSAKVWVETLALAWSDFAPHENNEILRIVQENDPLIRQKWHEHFDS